MIKDKCFYVYVLKSVNRNYTYIGLTDNIERRFNQHNKGHNKTTKPYLPFELKLVEKYITRQEARDREKYFKTGVGREFLKAMKM